MVGDVKVVSGPGPARPYVDHDVASTCARRRSRGRRASVRRKPGSSISAAQNANAIMARSPRPRRAATLADDRPVAESARNGYDAARSWTPTTRWPIVWPRISQTGGEHQREQEQSASSPPRARDGAAAGRNDLTAGGAQRQASDRQDAAIASSPAPGRWAGLRPAPAIASVAERQRRMSIRTAPAVNGDSADRILSVGDCRSAISPGIEGATSRPRRRSPAARVAAPPARPEQPQQRDAEHERRRVVRVERRRAADREQDPVPGPARVDRHHHRQDRGDDEDIINPYARASAP